MTPIKTGTAIATSVAMFALSALAQAATPPTGSTGAAISAQDTVHCYGINSCKGTADCKTAQNDCKGLNSCKGQGFKGLKAPACLKKGGTIGDIG